MNPKLFLAGAILVLSSLVFVSYYQIKRSQKPVSTAVAAPNAVAPAVKNNPGQSRIQIVFALDATGSMKGLISAAKEKIWSIAGSLAQADPAPVIEMGLIFYRDRGDAFVTKQVALSGNIDDVYEKLMQMSADGGGDEPESVNQALHEAIAKFAWDTSLNTYKTIFLVGDCPPHMDYRNDVKYPVSCTDAKRKDIVLNTILMGNNQEARRIWKEIAGCSQGSFTQVNMEANDISVNTPYDSAIAVLSDQLDDTRVYYGNETEKAASVDKMSKSKHISGLSKVNVKAQRAEFNSTKAGKDVYYGNKELLEEIRQKTISLESIKKDELPDEMKNMTADQKKIFIEKKIAQRDSLNKELVKYTKLRQDFIEKDLSKRKTEDVENSFSNQIYKSIRAQTEKKNIHLRSKTKY